jgi:DNA polymerase-3 subunit delta'
MKFSSLPGLQETKSLLTQSVSNHHLAHAQLFVGAEGALSLPLVVAFATYIHCQNRGADDACGICPACSKSMKLVHPDTHFVFPLSNIKGDKDEERFRAEMMKSWRSFMFEQPFGNLGDWTTFYGGEDKQAIISREESREIIKTLSLKPFESQHKIMIIWRPELMHPSAANGILKILEEPSSSTLFFLVTTAADQLLPTIVSRTQVVSVPRLTDDNVNQYLMEIYKVEAKKASRITTLADGDLRHAIQQPGGYLDWSDAAGCADHAADCRRSRLLGDGVHCAAPRA